MFLPLFEMINDVRDPHSIGVLKGNIRRNIKCMERKVLERNISKYGTTFSPCGKVFFKKEIGRKTMTKVFQRSIDGI